MLPEIDTIVVQVSAKTISPALKKAMLLKLQLVLADLKTEKEVALFLNDFLTPTELIVLAKRLTIAERLDMGNSYEEVHKELKVSSATISTVSETLKKPGIKKALQIMKAHTLASRWYHQLFSRTKHTSK